MGGKEEGDHPNPQSTRPRQGYEEISMGDAVDKVDRGRYFCNLAGMVFVSPKEKIKEKIRILFFAHNQVR